MDGAKTNESASPIRAVGLPVVGGLLVAAVIGAWLQPQQESASADSRLESSSVERNEQQRERINTLAERIGRELERDTKRLDKLQSQIDELGISLAKITLAVEAGTSDRYTNKDHIAFVKLVESEHRRLEEGIARSELDNRGIIKYLTDEARLEKELGQ